MAEGGEQRPPAEEARRVPKASGSCKGKEAAWAAGAPPGAAAARGLLSKNTADLSVDPRSHGGKTSSENQVVGFAKAWERARARHVGTQGEAGGGVTPTQGSQARGSPGIGARRPLGPSPDSGQERTRKKHTSGGGGGCARYPKGGCPLLAAPRSHPGEGGPAAAPARAPAEQPERPQLHAEPGRRRRPKGFLSIPRLLPQGVGGGSSAARGGRAEWRPPGPRAVPGSGLRCRR